MTRWGWLAVAAVVALVGVVVWLLLDDDDLTGEVLQGRGAPAVAAAGQDLVQAAKGAAEAETVIIDSIVAGGILQTLGSAGRGG